MPKLFCEKRGNALVPATKAAQKEMDRIKPGARVMVDAKEPRNIRFHRLYWQFCTFVSDALNDGPGDIDWTQEMVSDRLKLATGRAEVVPLPRSMQAHYGVTHALKPASISFAKMEEGEFGRFVESSMAYILTEFGPWIQDHEDWQHVREIVEHARMGEAA